MSSTGLSTLNKRAIWSSLPPLRTHTNLRTKNISRSEYKLHQNQVSKWTDFETTVRDFTGGVLGNPTPGFAEVREDEMFWVGNELGVQSRFVEHVGQTMGTIYEKLDYGVLLGDYQSGISMKVNHADMETVPDSAIIEGGSNHLRILGELKTDWTFRPGKGQNEEEWFAQRFGTYYPMG